MVSHVNITVKPKLLGVTNEKNFKIYGILVPTLQINGDAIGRILEACGHEVHKEYYVNDAGRQIDILTASVYLRLADLNDNQMLESSYKGEYIKEIASDFSVKFST